MVFNRILIGVTLLTHLSACAWLGISPTEAPTTHAAAPILKSQKFHTVSVSPHTTEVRPGDPWRFYIQIRNGSALPVAFDTSNVHVFFNGNEVIPLSSADIRRRILDARSENFARIEAETDPLAFNAARDIKDEAFDRDWEPGEYIYRMKHAQESRTKAKQEVERRTRLQLDTLEAHALVNKTLSPGERYESFVEVPLPQNAKKGDTVGLRIGIEPDVHEFVFALLQ